MRKRRIARQEQQRRQRENRRYPFKETTKLIELVDKKHYGHMMRLVERLRPYLKDGEGATFTLTRLYFDEEKIRNIRQFVYDELALFMSQVLTENGLTCAQLVFFRYLAQPEHCNLGITENTLKAVITEAIRRNS